MPLARLEPLVKRDVIFHSALKESRERLMLMLLIFIIPSKNKSMKEELLRYIDLLFDPQSQEKQEQIVKDKETEIIKMMGKEFIAVSNNTNGEVTVLIKDNKDATTP